MNGKGTSCKPCRSRVTGLCLGAAGSAPLVRGSFPVADKHFRGSWLCQDPGPGIWRPPGQPGSREIHVSTAAAVPATFPKRNRAAAAARSGSWTITAPGGAGAPLAAPPSLRRGSVCAWPAEHPARPSGRCPPRPGASRRCRTAPRQRPRRSTGQGQRKADQNIDDVKANKLRHGTGPPFAIRIHPDTSLAREKPVPQCRSLFQAGINRHAVALFHRCE